MIEEEEILDSADETGYRLCSRQEADYDNIEGQVFSVQWDLNNKVSDCKEERLFLCMIDGRLITLTFPRIVKSNDINFNQRIQRSYNVKFRRLTLPTKYRLDTGQIYDGNNEVEKNITMHWDKLTSIPDRPDELIFLLGVSKNLMYSALPQWDSPSYPSEPFLSKTSRGGPNFSEYIFGTPILHITGHVSRITSLSVSPAGHILASADENGSVKLLLLRLLDSISVSRRAKAFSSEPHFTNFLPSYNVSIDAHNGPVFAIEWLPISIDQQSSEANNEQKKYCFATGSLDKCVKLWKVTCSTVTGILITPFRLFDTFSTHVLSLHCFSTKSMTARFNDDAATHYLFLSAGTSSGNIYVWQMSLSAINEAIEHKIGKALMMGDESSEWIMDDGKALHSLLQTSDHPIIHISISSKYTQGYEFFTEYGDLVASNLILVASDTSGIVHTHCVLDSGISSPGGKGVISPRKGSTSPRKTRDRISSLVRVDSKQFDAIVVSCFFLTVPSQEEYFRSYLVVAMVNGNILLVPTSSLIVSQQDRGGVGEGGSPLLSPLGFRSVGLLSPRSPKAVATKVSDTIHVESSSPMHIDTNFSFSDLNNSNNNNNSRSVDLEVEEDLTPRMVIPLPSIDTFDSADVDDTYNNNDNNNTTTTTTTTTTTNSSSNSNNNSNNNNVSMNNKSDITSPRIALPSPSQQGRVAVVINTTSHTLTKHTGVVNTTSSSNTKNITHKPTELEDNDIDQSNEIEDLSEKRPELKKLVKKPFKPFEVNNISSINHFSSPAVFSSEVVSIKFD